MKIGSSGPATPRTARRVPIEYWSWILWEVTLPLAFPLFIFFILWIGFSGTGHFTPTEARVQALVSVSGNGDLLVFAALLLVNISAKIRILDLPKRPRGDLVFGDLNAEVPSLVAFLILSIYVAMRIVLDVVAMKEPLLYKFYYSIGSAILLVFIFLWIDALVWKMHHTVIRHRISARMVESHYYA